MGGVAVMHEEDSKTAPADIKGQHHELVEIGKATLADQVQRMRGPTHVLAGAGRACHPRRGIRISRSCCTLLSAVRA